MANPIPLQLLMSTPERIAGQMEPAIREGISGAALVFSQQAAPTGSSCALQTKFLENLVAKFRKQDGAQSERSSAHTEQERESQPETSDQATWSYDLEKFTTLDGAADQPQMITTFDFAEEATWASLIAEAGFCAQDGNFFPSDYRI